MPPHWFRPLNPDPHPMKDGEKVITKFKSKDGNRKFAVTVVRRAAGSRRDPVLEDDDLDRDDD